MEMSWSQPYASKRSPVMARNVVATSQPLGAQAGLRMLAMGGNAVDAAIATAIAMTVLEPTSNGIGSDAFAIVWDGQHLHGFNGSGRSPAALTPERFAGKKVVGPYGWDAVTVPGCVDTWVRLSERFGRLKFEQLFAPAIEYAGNGYALTPIIAAGFAPSAKVYAEFSEWNRVFMPGGTLPKPGDILKLPDHARTLEEIAKTRGESFYRGELARKIATASREDGGVMSELDLASHMGAWVEPVSQEYHGVRLHELPPNGQGLAALIALGILRHRDVKQYAVDSVDSIHLQAEAMKLAFAEVLKHVADPAHMKVKVEQLLDEGKLKELAERIDMKKAVVPKASIVPDQGTVYLTAADERGMMVSYIQSNFLGFGSGVVVPGTGIALQNRGHCFVLEEGHVNRVGPAKRPYHTIIPAFVTREGAPLMSFGVMGGHMQPQGHVQMMVRLFDYGQNPQAASDAVRWQVNELWELALEEGFAKEVAEELRARGHAEEKKIKLGIYGGFQGIMRMESGWYLAGSDHRKDGQAVGY